MAEGDSKDLALAALGAAGTVAGVGGAALAAAGGLVAVAWNQVGGRNRKRAEKLFDRMRDLEEDAEAFEAEIHRRLLEEDEALMVALRALINGALDAITPAALVPLAQIGREYLRGETPAWVARAGIRILSEVTDTELGALRQVAASAVVARRCAVMAANMWSGTYGRGEEWGVAFRLTDGLVGRPRTLNALPGFNGREAPPAAAGHGERLFDLMLRHGVGDAREGHVASERKRGDKRPFVELGKEATDTLISSLSDSETAG